MIWAVLILFSFGVCIWLWGKTDRLSERVSALEIADIERGFRQGDSDPWQDMEPIDEDLPDMSQEVTFDDDLT